MTVQEGADDVTDVGQNKDVSRRWIEVFNLRDDAAEADVRAPEFVAFAPASLEPDPLRSEAWVKFLAGFVEGFPDLRLTVESAVGEGDLVAQRIHFEGTHTGVFQGLPPTGRRVTFDGLELNRHGHDGRVVEHWFQLDALSLLKQLGLVVIPGPRLLPRILTSSLRRCARSAEHRLTEPWREARGLTVSCLPSRSVRPFRSTNRARRRVTGA